MTTKILHVSDTHLGRRQYQSDVRREDFADSFEAAIAIAINEDVDAVTHGGDLFDDPIPNLPTVNRCVDIVSKLSEADIPFYGIVGNHERKLDDQWLDLINRVDNTQRLTQSPTVLNDEVALYGIDAVRSPAWDTADFTLEEPEDEDLVTLLWMHELFQPFVPEHRGDPYDLAETIDRFNFKPDAIALGDYHAKCQDRVNDVLAFYPGSTERCKVNETGKRGVYIIEIEDGDIALRFRTIADADTTVDAPRDFLVVNVEFGTGDGISRVQQRINEELGDDDITEMCVVVTLLGEDVPVTTREVYEYLKDQGAAVSHVTDDRTVDVDIDVDVETRDAEDIDSMVDDAVSDLDIDAAVTDAEELVRDRDVNASDIRTLVNNRIAEIQDEQFDEVTIERRQG